jgi:hypothetical protein
MSTMARCATQFGTLNESQVKEVETIFAKLELEG